MEVKLRYRRGWYFAVVPRQRGLGRAIVARLGTRDETEARTLIKLANLEQQALAAKADAIGLDVWTRLLAGRRVRVRDAVERYAQHGYMVGKSPETIDQSARTIDCFLRHTGLANQPIAAVKPEHVSDFVNRDNKLALTSRRTYLAVLDSFLKWCVAEHMLVRNPALDIVVRTQGLTQEQLIPKPRQPFTDEEVAKLLEVIPRTDFWHGAVRVGFEFGLRLSDVAKLEDGNIVANRMRIFTRKGKRVVDEPMSPETAQWFLDWKPARPESDTPYVFPAQAAMRSQTLSMQFAHILRRAGIADRCFHSLRKTATARVWKGALAELGDKQARALAGLVMKHGYAKVQQLLAHAPGSTVTADAYLPRA